MALVEETEEVALIEETEEVALIEAPRPKGVSPGTGGAEPGRPVVGNAVVDVVGTAVVVGAAGDETSPEGTGTCSDFPETIVKEGVEPSESRNVTRCASSSRPGSKGFQPLA